ncbi:MAG: hypothetical protein Tsb0013_21440 [Phycisphaerales bacterium]
MDAPRTMTTRTLMSLLAMGLMVMGGCSVFSGAGAPATPVYVSGQTGDRLTIDYADGVYIESDNNTADLYFTTIPGLGQPGVPMQGVSGSVLHVHMFLEPRAGKTPIDFTAANITVTHILVAQGAIGVYGGAGFMLPAGDAGSATFGGALREVTLRPTARTDGFADRLGWNELAGSLRARRDEAGASRIAAWVDAVLADGRLVTTAESD